jgi:hypothetical protein
MRDILIEHAERYPGWQMGDVYKLVHQGALGSEHAVTDEAYARARLTQEIGEMGPGPKEPLVDVVVPDGAVVRVHLRPYVRLGLDPESLLQAFVRTAREFRGSPERLEAGLAEAAQLVREGRLGFQEADVVAFGERMRRSGFPAIHHSDEYVALYRPAYRVVAQASMSEELRALCGEEGASRGRSS